MPAETGDPITPEQIGDIYQTLIRPTLFEAALGDQPSPTLVLLGGQPGSGKSRASARLIAEYDGMVALSGDDLRIFHPHFRKLINDDPEHAGPTLAEATRPWVRSAIQDALENRHSLLLEGTFGDPEITLATADRFRQAGFQVRIVVLASPRILSVITVASRYLRDLRMGAPARFTRLSAHDRGYDGTTRLLDALATGKATDRITVLGRGGGALFDQNDQDTVSLSAARDALIEGRNPTRWGARSTMELLGELKQITNYATTSGGPTADIADLLIEAHNLALDEVVPRLSIDADSPQARFIRQAVTEQSVALLRSVGADAGQLVAEAPISALGTDDLSR